MKRLIQLVIVLIFCSVGLHAQIDTTKTQAPRISLITCHAGSVMYELCGHAAFRVQHNGLDMAVNYGLFEFQTENFALKFLKGETDYRVGAYPFDIFMRHYLAENRRVVEQELNLTSSQSWELLRLLDENLRPENCVYRYNYVKNNCATKPIDLIEKVVKDSISFSEPSIEGAKNWTFRDEMRHFHQNYPWYQLGIDLALGSGIDYTLPRREKMFAPIALESMMRGATITDSLGNKKAIVTKENVINEGVPAQLPPTPFILTPNFIFSIILLISIFISAKDIKNKKTSRWLDSIIFGIFGFASLLVTFLIFISVNEATSPNYLYLWLNPLCFIPAICIWIKKCSRIVFYYHITNIVALILLTIILTSGVQIGNKAFIPLLLMGVIRSATNIYNLRCVAKKTK